MHAANLFVPLALAMMVATAGGRKKCVFPNREVTAAMRSIVPKLNRYCARLRAAPGARRIEGRIRVRFTLTPRGHTEGVVINENTTGSGALAAHLRLVVDRMQVQWTSSRDEQFEFPFVIALPRPP